MYDSINQFTLAWMPGTMEWVIILIVALLIFGKRLPEVGKSLGKGIVEFKKGIKGVEDEIDQVDREVDDAASKPQKQIRAEKNDAAIAERNSDTVSERTNNQAHT